MITFRLKQHDILEVVEIFDGNRLVGVLYPQEWGVRLVSKYLDYSSIKAELTDPPTINIRLP